MLRGSFLRPKERWCFAMKKSHLSAHKLIGQLGVFPRDIMTLEALLKSWKKRPCLRMNGETSIKLAVKSLVSFCH